MIHVSYQGPCGPRIFKNVSFFYIRMRVKGEQNLKWWIGWMEVEFHLKFAAIAHWIAFVHCTKSIWTHGHPCWPVIMEMTDKGLYIIDSFPKQSRRSTHLFRLSTGKPIHLWITYQQSGMDVMCFYCNGWADSHWNPVWAFYFKYNGDKEWVAVSIEICP